MKLHEVIIKLVNNRDKGLMFKDAAGRIATLETGEFCVRFKGEKSIIDVDEEWEEIKQPVPWQEALEAHAHGKAIKLVIHTGFKGDVVHIFNSDILMLKSQNGYILTADVLLTGTWYIED